MFRRHNGSGTSDDFLTALVGHNGVQDQPVFFRDLLCCGHGGGNRVPHINRLNKAQLLAQIDGSRARQLGAQHIRNKASGQHSVGDTLAEHRALGVLGVNVGGVEVAGEAGVQDDVGLCDGFGEGRAVADLDGIDCLHDAKPLL